RPACAASQHRSPASQLQRERCKATAIAHSLEAIDGVRQNLQESFRLTRHPRFPHDLARIIHNADARFLDRNIKSSKIVHAALLLLMLEAAYADLVSPSA